MRIKYITLLLLCCLVSNTIANNSEEEAAQEEKNFAEYLKTGEPLPLNRQRSIRLYFEEKGQSEVLELLTHSAIVVDYDQAIRLGTSVSANDLFKSLETGTALSPAILSLIGVVGDEGDMDRLKTVIETPPEISVRSVVGAMVGLIYASKRINLPWLESYLQQGLHQEWWVNTYSNADPSVQRNRLEVQAKSIAIQLTGAIAKYMPREQALRILEGFRSGFTSRDAKWTEYEKTQLNACDETIMKLKEEEIPVANGKP